MAELVALEREDVGEIVERGEERLKGIVRRSDLVGDAIEMVANGQRLEFVAFALEESDWQLDFVLGCIAVILAPDLAEFAELGVDGAQPLAEVGAEPGIVRKAFEQITNVRATKRRRGVIRSEER